MPKVNVDNLVQEAQKRGILLTEDPKSKVWRAEYLYADERFVLDDPTPEGVFEDMEALIAILAQDELYNFEYLEDADRYAVSVNGTAEPFVAQKLRDAFAQAKEAVMAKAKPVEQPKKRATRPTRQPEPELVEEVHVQPTSPPTGVQQPVNRVDALPPVLVDALADLLNAMTNLVSLISARVEVPGQANVKAGNGQAKEDELGEFTEPEVETNAPPPRRRASRAQK
jgi:hypothetical protein